MVASNGTLSWTVPGSEKAVTVPLVLTLKSKDGPPRSHYLAVRVVDEELPPPKVIPLVGR